MREGEKWERKLYLYLWSLQDSQLRCFQGDFKAEKLVLVLVSVLCWTLVYLAGTCCCQTDGWWVPLLVIRSGHHNRQNSCFNSGKDWSSQFSALRKTHYISETWIKHSARYFSTKTQRKIISTFIRKLLARWSYSGGDVLEDSEAEIKFYYH